MEQQQKVNIFKAELHKFLNKKAIIGTFASNGVIVETEGIVKAFDPNYGNIILMTEKEKILVKQFFRIRRVRNGWWYDTMS